MFINERIHHRSQIITPLNAFFQPEELQTLLLDRFTDKIAPNPGHREDKLCGVLT